MSVLLFDVFNWSSSSIKGINSSIWKGMSIIYYWEKPKLSKLRFLWKENFKKGTNCKGQKGTGYIPGNVYLGIIAFSCLSSTKQCFRFFLSCIVRKIKGFYQSCFGNEVDFRDIINASPNISSKNWNFKNLRHGFGDEGAMIKTILMSFFCWRTLVTFFLSKERYGNALLTLTVNYRKIVQTNELCHSKQQ